MTPSGSQSATSNAATIATQDDHPPALVKSLAKQYDVGRA